MFALTVKIGSAIIQASEKYAFAVAPSAARTITGISVIAPSQRSEPT